MCIMLVWSSQQIPAKANKLILSYIHNKLAMFTVKILKIQHVQRPLNPLYYKLQLVCTKLFTKFLIIVFTVYLAGETILNKTTPV